MKGLWGNAEPFEFLDSGCLLYVYNIEISSDYCSFLDTGFYFALPFYIQCCGYSLLPVAAAAAAAAHMCSITYCCFCGTQSESMCVLAIWLCGHYFSE